MVRLAKRWGYSQQVIDFWRDGADQIRQREKESKEKPRFFLEVLR